MSAPGRTPRLAVLDDGNPGEEPSGRVEALARRVEALWATQLDDIGDPVTLGHYELDQVIGRGSHGVVFAAFDRTLEREVALKVARFAVSERDVMAEARALARINHPNVVRLHELGCVDGFAYLVTELADGGTMAQWIRESHEWREVVVMFVQAARGLAAAHRVGVAHGDVKPGNMLIRNDGRVQLADFGFARTLGRRGPYDNQGRHGTDAYLAPECWVWQGVDPFADQFSFCVALWEALYGCRPWSVNTTVLLGEAEPSKRRTPAGVPAELERVLRRGLSTQPRDRYPSMDTLADALGRTLLAADGRRRRWGGGVAAGLVLILGGLALGSVLASSPVDLPQAGNPER